MISITQFEDLPNELFYILFNYFDVSELYKSIYGLNLRFKNLINSLSCYYLYLEPQPNYDMINIFASKIKSVYIKANADAISLIRFQNSLSVLVLENLTERYLNELPSLIHLRYLRIKRLNDPALSNKLTRYVVSSTRLHHLSLPYWCLETENHIFSSLHSLRLYRVFDENKFIYLLNHLPNLIYVHLYEPSIKLCPLVDDILPNIYPCLTYFRLHLKNGFTNSQLDFYLVHVSHIKSFYFSTSPCLVYSNQIGPYAVLNSIASIVEKRLIKLQRFLCSIIFEITSNDPFDITKVHTMYEQNYSIKFERNLEKFKSIWTKN